MTPLLPTSLTFAPMVSQERENEIVDRLTAYNRTHAPLWEQNHDKRFAAAPLHLFVLDPQGSVIGGIVGRTHALRSWLEVSILWVDEMHRGLGLGRELMARAETEALHRGCLYARLSTSHYQAPRFYEKLGYVLYGTLENCLPGDIAYYYYKQLTSFEDG